MRLATELKLNITYGVESERRVATVRNHAGPLAKGNYIGTIDDYKFAPPMWLLKQYRAIQNFDVDRALGPVFSLYCSKSSSMACQVQPLRIASVSDQ